MAGCCSCCDDIVLPWRVQLNPGPLETVDQTTEYMPGEEPIWVLVIGEMVVFTIAFGIYLFYRNADIELYQSSQARLLLQYGFANTVLLLFGSWFVATSITAYRRRDLSVAKHCIGLGALCGVSYSVLRYFEYSQNFADGIAPATNDFFMFYFIFTGIHLTHVIAGVGLLAYFSVALSGRDGVDNVTPKGIENGATLWHMCDLLWIVLFLLLYLLP